MKVLKFGGTSVSGSAGIRNILAISKQRHDLKNIVIVVSAFSGVTSGLHRIADLAAKKDRAYSEQFEELRAVHIRALEELFPDANVQEPCRNKLVALFAELGEILHAVNRLGELTPHTIEAVMAYGELFSATLLANFLQSTGLVTHFVDARQYILTDNKFGRNVVLFSQTFQKIKNLHASSTGVFVVTGYIAANEAGVTTTLGRGGSDYTGAIWAAALDAEELEIWTDVDGIMSTDPRRVKKALPMQAISYTEAIELASCGAKVIYPPTIKPVMDKNIPVRILNSFNPSFEGTIICRKAPKMGAIRGISLLDGACLLRVEGSAIIDGVGFASRMFGALARAGINIIVIAQTLSEYSICVVIRNELGDLALSVLRAEFAFELSRKELDNINVEKNLSVVAIVGENMRAVPGVSGKLLTTVGKAGINVISIVQGSSEHNISLVISSSQDAKALNAIHDAFFLSPTETVNLFVVGVGVVGGTLLQQIAEQYQYCLNTHRLDFKLIGIANSKFMSFNAEGFDFAEAANLVQARTNSNQPTDIAQFVHAMKQLNLSNSIFVDNTGSEEVANTYKEILGASISVVTPNKIANVQNWRGYCELREIQKRGNAKFFYETNVGAGLPVITTLESLLNSGEKIISIEAVLSGTMSYIFNQFMEGGSLSSIVREAKKLGYTEPDPRIDLSGLDIARKILILARECGYNLELTDITVEKIVPEHCFTAKSVEEFFNLLDQENEHFEKLRAEVRASKKALRYMASFEKGQAKVFLDKVDSNHPAYMLRGTENLIAFKTENYKDYPLVVKGPGAGAAVTAGGVFADIIRLAHSNL